MGCETKWTGNEIYDKCLFARSQWRNLCHRGIAFELEIYIAKAAQIMIYCKSERIHSNNFLFPCNSLAAVSTCVLYIHWCPLPYIRKRDAENVSGK